MNDFPPPSSEQTQSGRQAEAEWERAKKATHDRITAWAEAMAGTALDLDVDLEAAGLSNWWLRKYGRSAQSFDGSRLIAHPRAFGNTD
ncbi:MAG TPA: hypothetical protein VHY84_08755 [Bryobacteraceae bacterium]|nr:hypothetical protein [Bryobacteraceae bacterium]